MNVRQIADSLKAQARNPNLRHDETKFTLECMADAFAKIADSEASITDTGRASRRIEGGGFYLSPSAFKALDELMSTRKYSPTLVSDMLEEFADALYADSGFEFEMLT